MDIDLDLAAIGKAARIVDPVFRDSPQFFCEQLCAALGRTVLVKIETANPLGSFKGRGADFLVRSLPDARVLLLATYRSDELHRRHPLRPLLTSWERMRPAGHLELRRFDREEVTAQLTAILGSDPAPG